MYSCWRVRNLLSVITRLEVTACATVAALWLLHHLLMQALVLSGAWVGSLGNTYFKETLAAYLITLVVLVALAATLAALIRGEICGRRGGGGRQSLR